MRTALLALLPLVALPADAHPFSKDEYSLAGAMQLTDKGVQAVVILEVPVPKVLEAIQASVAEGASKRKAVKDHDEGRYADLAKGLTLTVEGVEREVTWRPVDHPSNGKAAEGFFLYWVGADVPMEDAWGDEVQVVLKNDAYGAEKMVYTGSAAARDGWSVTTCSATDTLGVDVTKLEKTDPRAWTKDASLRELSVTWTR